ncbi:MAG: hypothetical protein AAFZ80_08300 [Cyanobacteria bacterium P01_A01_bin.105]
MFSSSSKHVVHYRIQPQPDTVRLTVWEASQSAAAHHPYSYILNYSLKTLEDADYALRHHLFVNGVATAIELDLPNQGCIHVLPYSTWSDANVLVEAYVEEYAEERIAEKVG